ncbi:MAG TPA: hypothetical protein VGJ20_00305 [Xanthobacteraceae bacterium]
MKKLLLAGVAVFVLAASPIALAFHGGGGGGGMGGGGHFGGGHFGGGGPPGGGWGGHFGPPGGHFGPPGGGPPRAFGPHGPPHAFGPHGLRPGSGPQRFGQSRFSERHFRGRREFFRHRHVRVFIAGGPGWIWCDDSSWWYSPWWWDYCGDYGYDY